MAHLIYSVLPMPPRDIISIHPDDTVIKCINMMVERNIGALIVLDDEKNLFGMVSERDILRSCFYKGLDPQTATAKDVAYKDVTILSSRDAIEKAMQAITDTKRRHVLIQENDKLIAILSIGDLLYHLLDDKIRVIEQLENYIHS